MNMLSEAVVQQWIGTDYETKILYTCKKCGVPFEKIDDKLYTRSHMKQEG